MLENIQILEDWGTNWIEFTCPIAPSPEFVNIYFLGENIGLLNIPNSSKTLVLCGAYR
jgi:hypothetical protein